MNIAIIGSGGREHAIALKLSESKNLNNIFTIPGNPGTKSIGNNVDIKPEQQIEILKFCREQKIDLVIIGPEKPLTDGLADLLRENEFTVFGPSKEAARIEGEKSFAKNLMKKYRIPTAAFEVFSKENYDEAVNYLHKIKYPTVIKANGIAAGKGVIIADTFDDAREALKECFVNSSFGSAGDKVVIEEFMSGQEASIFAITDGEEFILLPAAQDHKRIHDGDTGKNTGGMGAYAPTPFVTEEITKYVSEKIIRPTLAAMKAEGKQFNGCLYCGLMLTEEGPKVVEYNCRFGDPETQVVLPLLKGDFLELLNSAAKGKVKKDAVKYSGGSSITVVMASRGYPDSSENGVEILGLGKFPKSNVHVIHAGTKEVEGKIVTNGGRVLNIVSSIEIDDLKLCKQTVYEVIPEIFFDGMQYRKDISDKALNVQN
jgi:phosphoribosylamine---glycine ligase